MKRAPRLVLPNVNAPMLAVPVTPRGISPRTLSYICDPSSEALASSGSPSPDTNSSGTGPSPGSAISEADLLLARSSCSPSSDTNAFGTGPSPGSVADLILARSSCSPSSDGLSSVSASPSPSDISLFLAGVTTSLSSDKSEPRFESTRDKAGITTSLSSSDKSDKSLKSLLSLPPAENPPLEATSPRVLRSSSFSKPRLFARESRVARSRSRQSDDDSSRAQFRSEDSATGVSVSVPPLYPTDDCCLRFPGPDTSAVSDGVGYQETLLAAADVAETCNGIPNADVCPTPRGGSALRSGFGRGVRRVASSSDSTRDSRAVEEQAASKELPSNSNSNSNCGFSVKSDSCNSLASSSSLTAEQSFEALDNNNTDFRDFRDFRKAGENRPQPDASLWESQGRRKIASSRSADFSELLRSSSSSCSGGAFESLGSEYENSHALNTSNTFSTTASAFNTLNTFNNLTTFNSFNTLNSMPCRGRGSLPEAGGACPPSPRLPRFPSLSRLRLSSREPEPHPSGLPPLRPPPKLPPQLITHSASTGTGTGTGAGAGLGTGGCVTGASPTRGRRLSGSSSLKRKRPPMLDIPLKDAFTASPLSTPERSEEGQGQGQEEVEHLSEEGEGFAALCKRGRRREVMEDRYRAVGMKPEGREEMSYFGVFDGHGGTAAAEFTAGELHLSLVNSLQETEDAESALVNAFMETDKKFLTKGLGSGSSVVTCLVTPSEVIVGHAGDCRAVMRRGGKTLALTRDHKASREDERERIESLGGHVDDFTGTWRVQGIMAVTRGMGDQHLKEYISSVPETSRVDICSPEDFLILASDGLWDVVTNEEAVAVASAVLFPSPLTARTDSESLASQLQALLSPTVDILQSGTVDVLQSGTADKPQSGTVDALQSGTVETLGSPVCAPLTKKGFRSASTSCLPSETPTPKGSDEACEQPPGLESKDDDEATSKQRPDGEQGSCSAPPANDRLSGVCKKLVELAVKRGSNDDVSVLVVLPQALRY